MVKTLNSSAPMDFVGDSFLLTRIKIHSNLFKIDYCEIISQTVRIVLKKIDRVIYQVNLIFSWSTARQFIFKASSMPKVIVTIKPIFENIYKKIQYNGFMIKRMASSNGIYSITNSNNLKIPVAIRCTFSNKYISFFSSSLPGFGSPLLNCGTTLFFKKEDIGMNEFNDLQDKQMPYSYAVKFIKSPS